MMRVAFENPVNDDGSFEVMMESTGEDDSILIC